MQIKGICSHSYVQVNSSQSYKHKFHTEGLVKKMLAFVFLVCAFLNYKTTTTNNGDIYSGSISGLYIYTSIFQIETIFTDYDSPVRHEYVGCEVLEFT